MPTSVTLRSKSLICGALAGFEPTTPWCRKRFVPHARGGSRQEWIGSDKDRLGSHQGVDPSTSVSFLTQTCPSSWLAEGSPRPIGVRRAQDKRPLDSVGNP